MPELPEIEVLRRQVEKEFAGKRIKSVEVKARKFVKTASVGPKRVQKKDITPKEFDKRIAGAKLKAVNRKGKYLALELDNKEYVVFHLGMSGHLVRATGRRAADKHNHVTVHFTQGPHMRFIDARRFGECFVASVDEYAGVMDRIGFDPVNDQIPWQRFMDVVARRSTKMKTLLMDQDFIAGLGNIYSDEVLFQAGLSWDRPSGSLTPNEVRRLSRSIGEVLQEAIKDRGTTLEDGEWRDLYDAPGEHQERLNVFQREGEPCRRCRTPVRRTRIGQRSHFFCPQCQSGRR